MASLTIGDTTCRVAPSVPQPAWLKISAPRPWSLARNALAQGKVLNRIEKWEQKETKGAKEEEVSRGSAP